MISFFVGVALFFVFIWVIGHIIHLASYGDEVYVPPKTEEQKIEEMHEFATQIEEDCKMDKKIDEKRQEIWDATEEQFLDWLDLNINGERVTAVQEEYEIDNPDHQAMDTRHYTITDSDGVVGMIDQPLDVQIPTALRTGLFRKKIDF